MSNPSDLNRAKAALRNGTLVLYSRAALFADVNFQTRTNRLFDFKVPYVVPIADTVPQDWGHNAVRFGEFMLYQPYGLGEEEMKNLTRSKSQTALVLEVRGQHEFVLQVPGREIEIADRLPVEAITVRTTQAQINEVLKALVPV